MLAGKGSLSLTSCSNSSSLASLAESSWSVSPAGARRKTDVEKGEARCDRMIAVWVLKRLLGAEVMGERLAPVVEARERTRGAERARARADSIMCGLIKVIIIIQQKANPSD